MGGGIAIADNSNPTISNCNIASNTAYSTGGGIWTLDNISTINSFTLTNTTIRNNTAPNGGSGIWLARFNATINNLVVDHNSNKGIVVIGGSTVNIANSTIANNTNYGIALTSTPVNTVYLRNSIVWGNTSDEINVASGSGTLTATYSDIEGGYNGTGNKNANPNFINAANNDYHLGNYSGAIDCADGNYEPTLDIENLPRYDDLNTTNTGIGTPPYVDMGAYEKQDNSSTYKTGDIPIDAI